MFQVLRAHYRSFFFLLFLLVLTGAVIASYLPVALLPPVSFPKIRVSLETASKPINLTNIELTTPVESIVRQVPGVQGVRSRTSRGKADISIDFGWGVDMERAALQISSAIAQISSSLPSDLQLTVTRMNPTSFPILGYSLVSNTLSPTALYDLARYQLMPLFLDVSGVADVQVLGGAIEEYHVLIDPIKLKAVGLALSDVDAMLTASNLVNEVGRLDQHYQLNLLVAGFQVKTLDQLQNLVLKGTGHHLIYLRDVAIVESAQTPQWISVTADGKDAVIIQVLQQPNSNSLQITHAIESKIDAFRKRAPQGVVISSWYDQSQLVKESASHVGRALIIGVVLAAGVLLVALGSFKIATIVLIVIPAVLLMTVIAMYLLNINFNMMSLGGLAAGIGLMLDDVIVVAEYIVRRVRMKRDITPNTIWQAAADFLPSLAGTSAATVVILMPLAFLGNVTGAFFQTLSLTMASGLVISFLAAWLAVPMLASFLLTKRDAEAKDEGSTITSLQTSYTKWMTKIFAKPSIVLCGLLPVLVIGAYSYYQIGSGFLPAMDEGGFILDYHAKPGTSLAETDRLVRQAESIIQGISEVDTYTRRTGTQLDGGVTDANEGDFFIRLKPLPRRGIDEVMNEMRSAIKELVPGLSIELAQLMEDAVGDLTDVPQPIEIKIFDDHPTHLEGVAHRVAAAIRSISGVVDVHNHIVVAGKTLEITIDPVKAALAGMDVASITHMLNDYLTGVVSTRLVDHVKTIGVRLWVQEDLRDNENALKNLILRAPNGNTFPLEQVATLRLIPGESEIHKDNLKRMVVVTGRISGRDLGSTIKDVQEVLDQPDFLPKSAYYVLGGLYQQQQVAFHGLLRVFVAAAALVFLLVLILFENYRIAAVIILMPLLSMSAVFIGLWITDIELNISSMMGMTMILGIMTEVAIFFFSEYQQIAKPDSGFMALLEAGHKRMRPIVMTTLTTILALLPLALSSSGASMHQPLAIAIISGMIVQLPLVLIVMPALFWCLRKRDTSSNR